MKRNFFKKLSFVLASAMVLTTLAPASGALAAGGPKLNSTNKYLHLGRVEEGTNEFNFNIKNKGKGWKYEWTSANQDVAKVNAKNGVTTATGVGSTKVTVVISDKDGEELEKLTAKVTVRDNIEVVKISNLPTEAIAVGEEYDFNRSYVTESGSSKKTSGITRWEVSPATATINDKGVFVATEAGEYTITANSFQSKAKYTEWLASKDSDLVTATVSEKVTVAGSMVDATQVDGDTVKVKFNTVMTEEAVKANLGLSVVVGSTKVKELIKEIKLDDTGKAVDVTVYVPFNDESTYVVDYKDMEPVQFVAAKREAEDVASMSIEAKEAEVGEPTDIDVRLYNKDGVDITTDDLLLRVTTESDHNSSYLDDREITMYNIGDIAVVKATFHTYEWNDSTGEELGNLTASGAIKCVDEIVPTASGLKAWTLVKLQDDGEYAAADWDEVNHSLAAEDDNLRLVVQATMTDDEDDIDSEEDDHKFTFTSSNEDVLFIHGETGDLYPIKPGAAVIVVKHDDKSIGAISVTIGAKRKAVSLTADSYSFALSNATSFDDTKTIELTVKDQFGDEVALDLTTPLEEANDKAFPSANITFEDNKITFNGNGAEEGTYRFKVKANDLTRFITVTIKDVGTGDEAKASYYRAELVDGNKYDIKLDADNPEKNVTIKIFGYNKKNVRVSDVTDNIAGNEIADGSTFKIEVTDPKNNVPGDEDALKTTDTVGKFNLAEAVSGEAFKVKELGTYKVKATRTYVPTGKTEAVTQVINTTYFTVEDTQKAPTFSIDLRVAKEATSYTAAVLECLSFSLDGKKFSDTQELDIEFGTEEDGDYIEYDGQQKAYIKNLYYNEDIGETGSYIRHKIEVKTTISWQEP